VLVYLFWSKELIFLLDFFSLVCYVPEYGQSVIEADKTFMPFLRQEKPPLEND